MKTFTQGLFQNFPITVLITFLLTYFSHGLYGLRDNILSVKYWGIVLILTSLVTIFKLIVLNEEE